MREGRVQARQFAARFIPMRIGRIARKLSAMFIRATILNAVLLSVLVAEVVGAAVKLAGG
jgi:hypothetical protein